MFHIIKNRIFLVLFCVFSLITSCQSTVEEQKPTVQSIVTGAERIDDYLPMLEGKKVGVLVNHSSLVNGTHLVDTLLERGVNIKKIFGPEHGYRGKADAGEKVTDGIDPTTNIPVISLYGKNHKAKPDQVADLDIVIFNLQDVGTRYYTYVGTMHYMMKACAEAGVKFLVLDRPNPNGHYVDGNILDTAFSSFVGMHPVPIVHGMTVGEYARMINGEGWLGNGLTCELEVMPCANYDHNTMYELPVRPSPNLPNLKSILLYPSLCLFEGSIVSVGRGTNKQFQVYGHPGLETLPYEFTPEPMFGAQNPKLKGKLCHGVDLSQVALEELYDRKQIDLGYLIMAYQSIKERPFFKKGFFDKLAGGDTLRKQIEEGLTEKEIKESWQSGLEAYKVMRRPYLLYAE